MQGPQQLSSHSTNSRILIDAMKRLIEKGIGVILLCIQIIMAAAAAYVFYAFVIEVPGEFVENISASNGGVIVWLLYLLIVVLGGGLAAFFGFIASGIMDGSCENALLAAYKKESANEDYFYGYPHLHGIDRILSNMFTETEEKIGKPIFAGLFQGGGYGLKMNKRSPCIWIPESVTFLRSKGLGIMLYKYSDADIEEDRNNAEEEMTVYQARKDESNSKYKASKDEQIERTNARGVRERAILKTIKGSVSISFVHLDNIIGGILFWAFNHIPSILCTALLYSTFAGSHFMWDYFDNLSDVFAFPIFCCFLCGYFVLSYREWWKVAKRLDYYSGIPDEYSERAIPNYKDSASKLIDFINARRIFICGMSLLYDYNILDIFQAFLDLHKEGWRMKIFPFSAERVRQEKADAAARGEEIVIFPDVDEIEARLAEEERKEQRIASIGEL